jgi:hypothetical protein
MLQWSGSYAVDQKKKVFSTVEKPLLNTPVSIDSLWPMHMFQGILPTYHKRL